MKDLTNFDPCLASAMGSRIQNPARILIVDDDPALRELHSIILKSQNYAVATAPHGAEGLRLLATGSYDLILTDRNMPQVDGVELIRRVRATGNRIPVVMVSGSLADSSLPDDVAPEVAAALPKPALSEQILAAVAFALRNSPGNPTIATTPNEPGAESTAIVPAEVNSKPCHESLWPWMFSVALGLAVIVFLCGCQTVSKFAVQFAKRIEIDKTTQTLRAYEGTELFLLTWVSTGRAGRETPNGSYYAGVKHRMHYSTLYHNAPMPFSIQVSGNYFIHGYHDVPNYPASHGCIRVPLSGDNPAEQLFHWVEPGTPIVISGAWRGKAHAQTAITELNTPNLLHTP
jgi:DNA-binding response OmpR family regulator